MHTKGWEDTASWAQAQWGGAQLGDVRRTKRAVQLGQQLLDNPAGSLPEQTGNWAALKAAYRLLNEDEVTYEALASGHWHETRRLAAAQQVVLFVQDSSDLDYTHHRHTHGLGLAGNPERRGLMLHTAVALSPQGEGTLVHGVARQAVWKRESTHRHERRAARDARHTEFDVWADMIIGIGTAPAGVSWVSVGDRASDLFGHFRVAVTSGWQVLVRACKERAVQCAQGTGKLLSWARSLSTQATTQLEQRRREDQAARTLELHLAFAPVTLLAPKNGKERGQNSIEAWCVRVWDRVTNGQTLEWVLISTLPVLNVHDALRCVAWYARRWVIEDYHKCLKTGCAIEARQLRSAAALQRLLGLLSVVAVRLLVLRSVARTTPEEPAGQHLDPDLLEVLAAKTGVSTEHLTVRSFWPAVAGLGGFLGRTSDGEPGWQTLWKGWLRLLDFLWAFRLARTCTSG